MNSEPHTERGGEREPAARPRRGPERRPSDLLEMKEETVHTTDLAAITAGSVQGGLTRSGPL